MLICYSSTAYYIAFGAHGPRAATPPGEGWKVLGYTGLGVAVSFVIFVLVRMGARGPPATMTKEYQEATNEYLKVCTTLFPWTGLMIGAYG
jgi:cytochrome c oxidase subunit 4